MNDNNLDAAYLSDMTEFKTLEFIYLSGNNMGILPQLKLPMVKTLSVPNAGLTGVSAGAFVYFTSLKKIDFSSNEALEWCDVIPEVYSTADTLTQINFDHMTNTR